ncbi:hypothetical protein FDI24_gp068 [Acidovorax phage ACP17]|uniref:Concanavalin A-like lectin/glucanases superfamily protein n=1 Tax=Acidovorax phage ACP17 TaxID=2010329 RepID=A0A218M2T3_9CAUD|nr:hypothetical protein FDI24_gp068 [Acidovorax phage ACP17]ASD50350.1 hypothetical protein [Acidovorax phage ACP17]
MAGYKSSVRALNPKVFITFDGDAVDDSTATFSAVPPVILDEMGVNNATLHISSSVYRGYRAGMPSMIRLEPSQQASVSFGFYGKQAGPNVWEKAYLEIPHSTSFVFPNNGDLSIVWMMNKLTDEEAYRSTSLSGAYNYATLSRPVFSKAGVFGVRIIYPWAGQSYMQVELPGGKFFNWVLPSWFHGDNHHMALTWKVVIMENGDNVGNATLYVDGQEVASEAANYYGSYPPMDVNSSIFIGGSNTPLPDHGDRNTSSLQIDQFAVFDKTLSEFQISRLSRKILPFEELILKSRPTALWTMQDIEDPNTTVAANSISSYYTGRYVGGPTRVTRGLPGFSQVVGSTSAFFNNGGQFVVNVSSSPTSPVIDIANPYSIMFWFKATSNPTATLFSFTGSESPFAGLTVSLNLYDNQYRSGAIQVQESEQEWVSAAGNYNDGQEHHCAIVKRGTRLELYLDGQLMGSKIVTTRSSGSPGIASMFSASPGRTSANGNAAYLAFYNYALDDAFISAVASYRKTYKVRGIVTLRGTPYKANVRMYSHFSGALLQEVLSDPNTGEYLAEMNDNRTIDIVVLNTQDPNVRYRVYGPVVPSEYEDAP